MISEERHNQRFEDIGRVEINELCAFPATLDNISREGCRVRYLYPIVVDLENDYELKITFARIASEGAFSLMCRPIWAKEVSGYTDIGFKFLHSTDIAKLNEYIEQLCEDSSDENIKSQISGSVCQII